MSDRTRSLIYEICGDTIQPMELTKNEDVIFLK